LKNIRIAVFLSITTLSLYAPAQRVMDQMRHIVNAGSLSGEILNLDKTPIVGATVTEYSPGSANQIATVKTDNDGHFELPRPSTPELQRLAIAATGMQTVYVQVRIMHSHGKLKIVMRPLIHAASRN
jgi:hypothetical protein